MSESCENCAAVLEQNDALQQRAVADRDRIDALVNTVMEKDHKIAALKGQLTKLRQDSPKMADAQEVFEFWVRRLGKNARTTFGPARQTKVIARLNEKSLHPELDRKAELKWAVRGMEAMPFVGPQGRQGTAERGGKRHDDLSLVCRDETTVERFMGYADDHAAARFKSFVSALLRTVPADASFDDEQPFHVAALCPKCLTAFSLNAMPGSVVNCEWIWLECSEGCAPGKVLEALRETDRRPKLVAA